VPTSSKKSPLRTCWRPSGCLSRDSASRSRRASASIASCYCRRDYQSSAVDVDRRLAHARARELAHASTHARTHSYAHAYTEFTTSYCFRSTTTKHNNMSVSASIFSLRFSTPHALQEMARLGAEYANHPLLRRHQHPIRHPHALAITIVCALCKHAMASLPRAPLPDVQLELYKRGGMLYAAG
jgi:hypothetical protein